MALTACGSSDESSAAADAGSSPSADKTLSALLPDAVKERGSIIVAGAFDTPPLIAADPKDASKPIGIAPDLAEAVGEILGVSIDYKNVQWPGQLPGLDAGTFDALWGQISTTAEREEGIVDQTSWIHSFQSLLVPDGNPQGIESTADVCGKKIAAPAGSFQTFILESLSKDVCTSQGEAAIDVKEYPQAGPAATALNAGQIDAYMDSALANGGIAKSADSSFDVVTLPAAELETYDTALLAIAVSKDNPGVSKAISGALQKLEEDGTYQEILDKHDAGDAALTNEQLAVNSLTATPAGEKVQ